jgi:hypothetical protein
MRTFQSAGVKIPCHARVKVKLPLGIPLAIHPCDLHGSGNGSDSDGVLE